MFDVDNPAEALAEVIHRVTYELPKAATGWAIDERLRQTCLSPTPAAVAVSGQLLLRVGFIGHAETIFDALWRLFPAMPAGLAGSAQVAMQCKDWARALRQWDDVIATFPAPNAYWMATRARVLIDLERQEEAAAILKGISRDFAHQPHSPIGLAHLAMHRHRWPEALALWDEVLARYPEHDSVPFSKTTRASVLSKLGRHGEAEAILREVIEADPWMVGAHVVLMYALVEMERYDEAAQEPEISIFADAAIPTLCRATMAILLQSRCLDEARTQFRRILQRAVDIESISLLFDSVPLLYEGWQRTEIWLDLLRRFDELQMRAAPASIQAYGILRARLKLCLGDHKGFLDEVMRSNGPERLGEFASSAREVAAAVVSPNFPDYNKPKIFGIGLSKTGTTTLAAALKTLGMTTLHFTNPLTCALVSDLDLHLFDALTDTPMCLAFEKFYYMFPASKFVYTIRPLVTWTHSMMRHWRRALRISDFGEFQRQADTPSSFRYGNEFCGIHKTLYLNHSNLSQAYEVHDLRVRRFFSDKPKDRFLVFDVFTGHGWPELCAFLDIEVPGIPFPFENRSPMEPGSR